MSNFVYDEVYSQDLSIINATLETGLREDTFLPSREIEEITIRGRDKPYFLDIIKAPLTLKLGFAFTQPWNEDLIRTIAKLFYVNYYKELYFSEDEDRVFFCMYTGDLPILHNYLKRGFVALEMRCADCYSYSQPKKRVHNCNTANSTIEFINQGDVAIKPQLIIKKIGDGDLSIQNFELKNLVDNEEIYVDNENEVIETNIQDTYRYDDHNGTFISMEPGCNVLTISGECELEWKWRFKKLQS